MYGRIERDSCMASLNNGDSRGPYRIGVMLPLRVGITYWDLVFTPFQDYKTYLDFVLALENRKEPAALQYIFKLLDIGNKGSLNVFSLNYFFRVCCPS